MRSVLVGANVNARVCVYSAHDDSCALYASSQGEIMQCASPYGSNLPQKNNVKRPTHISSLVNNLLIRLIDYTPDPVNHKITV